MEEKLILYRVHKTDVIVNVRAEDGNVWLNRRQMAALFARDVKTIGKHISNALREELRDVPTVAYFATVQIEGERKITRQVEYYGLDMILSVGYRVKSAEGVHFRRWANEVLREHLLRGYTVNRKRMEQLGKILEIAERSAAPEIAGLASIVREYMPGLNKLDAYDRQTIPKAEGNKGGWILRQDLLFHGIPERRLHCGEDHPGRIRRQPRQQEFPKVPGPGFINAAHRYPGGGEF